MNNFFKIFLLLLLFTFIGCEEKIKEYKVNVTSDIGIDIKYVYENNSINIITNEIKGYEFLGYFVNDEQIDIKSYVINSDVNIVCKYTPITYTINYIDVDNNPNPTSYTVLDEVTFKPLEKEGYKFLGFYNGDVLVEKIEKGTTLDMTLTPKFEKETYKLKIYDGENIILERSVLFEDLIEDIYDIVKDDHILLGLYENDVEFVSDIMPSKDVTLQSKWEYKLTEYKIYYNFNGGSVYVKLPYETKEAMVSDFIKDYNSYYKTTVTKESFFNMSGVNSNLRGFFTENSKWMFMLDYILDTCKKNNYQGNTFLQDANNEYQNTYLRSNVHAFINSIKYTSWPNSFDFSVDKYSNGYVDYFDVETVTYPKSYTAETETITLIKAYKKYNTFVNWTDQDGNVVTEIKKGTRKDYHLYANYIEDSYNIEYELNGGKSNNLVSSYYPGMSGRLYLNAPEKDGYGFYGWYETSDFTGNEVLYIENGTCRDYKLYAKWCESKLKDIKTISIYGDSISTFENYVPTDATFYYPIYSSTIKKPQLTWWKIVMEKLGLTMFNNISYSGSTVSGTSSSCGESDVRINKLVKNGKSADMIIIYLGINDCASNYSHTKFKESYINMINKVKNKCPDSKIFICTLPYETWTDGSNPDGKNYAGLRERYNSIIRYLAEEYNLGLLDIESAITKDTESITKRTYLGDNIHPNASGMQRIAQKIIDTLLEYNKKES